MITKNSFAKAQASSSAYSAEELLERLNGILDTTPRQEQYNAIKGLVNNGAVATLKKHFEIESYVSTHRMRWDLINAYNADK